ncbi:MAG TPA: TonB-dependent receptor [Pseudorhizobium sp.]|nr:TonB-dependent receptor [Pseudorhizobium sp.]
MNNKSCVALLLASAAWLTSPAQAQTEPSQTPEAEPAAVQSEQPDVPSGDIVVTANRRASLVSDVPIAISAFTQSTLDQKGIRDVSDLSRIAAGVTFTPGWGGSTNISIRGISSSVGAGTTGIYIDDTPIQVRALGASDTATNAYPAVFDVARIEVLRGPQGTLFGAGSQGGTIRFITPEPSLRETKLYVRSEAAVTEGGDPSGEIGAALSVPLVEDVLGLRVTGYARRDGGWIDRVDYGSGAVTDENSNAADTRSLQASLLFKPTSTLTISPSVYYQQRKQRDASLVWREFSDPSAGEFKSGQALRQPTEDSYYLYSLKASLDLGGVSIFSNTSYFDRDNNLALDYSNYTAELLGGDYRVPYQIGVTSVATVANRQKVFSQELRLQSNGDTRLTWVVGGFYQSAKQSARQVSATSIPDVLPLALYGLTTEELFGLPALQPGNINYFGNDDARDQQIAGFGQLDYHLTEQLTATLGVRVARTTFTSSNAQGGPFNGGPSSATARQVETPVTPKIGLQYKPDRDLMFYASASKGFRPGGGNNPVPVNPCAADLQALGLTRAPATYKSDSVWSYEVGAKGSTLGRKIQFETSAFYINWSDIQNAVNLANCGFAYIGNLGKARSKGFDVHVTAYPVQGLTLDAVVGYTSAKFLDTVLGSAIPGGGQAIITAAGDPLAVAPWTIALSGDYSFGISAGEQLDGYIHGEFNHTSGYSFGGETTASYDPFVTRRDMTNLASIRLGVRKDEIDASIFVNNVFNSQDRLATTHNTVESGLFRDAYFRARTVGVTVSYRR